MDIVTRAQDFAHKAHDSIGHKRKYSLLPYWTHTDEVAQELEAAGEEKDTVAAAHLHDVLEDVSGVTDPFHPYGIQSILANFGHKIFLYVFHLTDVFTAAAYPNANRALRKELERNRMIWVPNEVKSIKLADLISNTSDIVAHDPGFAVLYLQEKALMLPNLKGGNPALWEKANKQIGDTVNTL